MSSDIKVSVVIPIYNVEKYLEECLLSVINQTLEEIEIICVDDASTDTSLSIIRKYARKEQRIRIIAYQTNKSASQARKDGALQARGKYLMFLDGDDYLEKDACRNLYDVMESSGADIVHFGTNIINYGCVEEQRIENLKRLLAPYDGKLLGNNVFEGCFIEKKYRFSIWNKIYKRELCEKAFAYVKDGNFPKAQDLYAFFILCYFAESYYGIPQAYYNYRFGAGITGNANLSLQQLERYCHSVYVAEGIHAFISGRNEKSYAKIADLIRKDLLNDCVANWFHAIDSGDSAKGFDLLCQYWERKEIIADLCEKHFLDRKKIAEKIWGAKAIKNEKLDQVKTIGIFYHRYAAGGVQRVISLLIPLYLEMGYHVVLFTDEISEKNEYELPKEVVRVILPSSLTIDKSQYMERADIFINQVKEYHVDVMHYHAASSAMLLFDMLLLKLYKKPVILTVHETSFQNLLTMNTEIVNRPAIYRLADRVTVLSRTDQKYYQCLGVNAVYIPNPINHHLITRDLSKVEKNTILWIGRLDAMTKRCLDVIDVMRHVVRYVPDAKLLVLGNEVTPGMKEHMNKKITEHNLENNVIMCGYHADVAPYYCRCEMHVLTSISESFPMTISESKAYGMPLVMYELPFIEFSRDARGMVSVPQGDTKMMARAIVEILGDEDYKNKLQQEAHDSLRDFLAVDLKSEWNKIFSNLIKSEIEPLEDEIIGIMLRSLLQHYQYGAAKNNNEKNDLRRQVRELNYEVMRNQNEKDDLRREIQELQILKHSWDFRLGHFVFFIPHKIIGCLRNFKKILLRT